MAELSQAQLLEIFNYDPTTGILTWRERPRSHFLTDKGMKIANTMCAGNEASTLSENGYVRILFRHKGKMLRLYAHRAIWAMVYGTWPRHMVDHVNGDKRDNRVVNLRDATNRENILNSSIRRTNRYGVPGVYPDSNKWVARITVRKRTIYLGRFSTFGGAVKARKDAEIAYGFHPNHGRAKAA